MSVWLGRGFLSNSNLLETLIFAAKISTDFKPLSEDLASTLERLIPLSEEIESFQGKLDFAYGDLKELVDTLFRAREVVNTCIEGVSWFQKPILTREIQRIVNDMLKFSRTELHFLQFRTLDDGGLCKRIDCFSVPVYTDLCSVPLPDKDLLGFDYPLMELKKKLRDDSVGCLVVCAPPGCGKTTLVAQLCHDQEIKGIRMFKHIFYWVTSRTPNLRVMVQHLLLHNGFKDLTFTNDSQAANCLRKLLEELKGNGILLVFDDVFAGAESLLKTFQINLQDYKILVTSQFEFPSFGPTYHLKPLEHQDAKNLLIQLASPLPHHTNPYEFEDLLQKTLKRCNGLLPLVIEVVGVSLKGRGLHLWKDQVESWSEGKTILERPQPSFNALEPHLKECFMDMGSFLEDQKIRASVIIDLWVELYGTSSSSIVYMKYLNDLASQNLLKLIPLGRSEQEDGFYNGLLVTQHDVLRELAIHQSRLESILETKRLKLEIIKNKFPELYSNLRQPINARLLSIATDNLFSSSWIQMDCPNVEVLILNLSSSDYALPSFIAGMKKLKVLTIANHGVSLAKITNFSCLSSLPNLKRIRFEKASVTLLDLPQLRLGSLEKISFVMCSFGEVFYDCVDVDISKALPSLQEIEIDYCYDLDEVPYWISQVVSLKKLSVTNCYKLSRLPNDIDNLSKLEVLRLLELREPMLASCFNLCELPETTSELRNLRFLDISHCTGLRKLPLEIGKLQKKLKKISMSKCWRCELPGSVVNLENLEQI
ncbi:unnamed protein product [Brassica napus]|uniref:(rape) hypothetical protein n=1 Tax=Brassica napus TaxID=3708 RepID=A0A816K7W2_BRANA|nr:unnamed protein product [Brassica napus]